MLPSSHLTGKTSSYSIGRADVDDEHQFGVGVLESQIGDEVKAECLAVSCGPLRARSFEDCRAEFADEMAAATRRLRDLAIGVTVTLSLSPVGIGCVLGGNHDVPTGLASDCGDFGMRTHSLAIVLHESMVHLLDAAVHGQVRGSQKTRASRCAGNGHR